METDDWSASVISRGPLKTSVKDDVGASPRACLVWRCHTLAV